MRLRNFQSAAKQVLASFLAGLLVIQSVSVSAQPVGQVPEKSFASLTPPSRVAAFVSASGSKLNNQKFPELIIVQDLHFNYSVQRHIAQLLDFLSQKGAVGRVIAVEGAAGQVDNSLLTEVKDLKVRGELADFLMQNGELTGSQYYSVMSGQPKILQGIEDPAYFQANRDIFRLSYQNRRNALRQVSRLKASLLTLVPGVCSRPVRQLQRARRRFEVGGISMGDYWSTVHSQGEKAGVKLLSLLAEYINAPAERRNELLLTSDLYQALDDYAVAVETALAKTPNEQNLIRLINEFNLAERALGQHTTLEEIRHVAVRVDSTASLAQLLTAEIDPHLALDLNQVREALRSSVDFYVAALMRNKPMLENTLKLVPQNAAVQKPTVLVVGGFHTAYLTRELTRRGVSYAVYAPQVDNHTPADEKLYTERFMGWRLTAGEAARLLANRAKAPGGPRVYQGAGLVPPMLGWVKELVDVLKRAKSLYGPDVVKNWAARYLRKTSPSTPVYHAQEAAENSEVASTFAQLLSQSWKSLDAMGRRNAMKTRVGAAVSKVFFLPHIVVHELGHIAALALFSRMFSRGEIRMNTWLEIMRGIPFRGPPGNAEQWPNLPKYEKWAGVAANIAFGAAVSAAWFYFSPATWWGHAAFAYGSLFNCVFVLAEWVAELTLGRGELYSLRFGYDRQYPSLLSEEEGRKQLRRAVDHYLEGSAPLSGSTESSMVLVIRLDPSYRDIAEMRMGVRLSRLLRNRIYVHLVREIRRRMPRTLVAATKDENQLLVIVPPGIAHSETVRAHVRSVVEELYAQTWFTRGYHLANVPDLTKLRSAVESKSRRKWQEIVAHLEAQGIYLSEYAGGVALIKEPMGDQINAPGVGEWVARVAASVNARLESSLSDPMVPTIKIDCDPTASPRYPITLSVIGTFIRKSDELYAWSQIPMEMERHDGGGRRRLFEARMYMEKNPALRAMTKWGRHNPLRRDLILSNLERILQSMMLAAADRLNIIALQGNVHSGDTVDMRWTENNLTEASERRAERRGAAPLLDLSLEGQSQPVAFREPADADSQVRSQTEAALRLKDFDVRMDPDVERMRADWNQAVEIYRRSMQRRSRTTILYQSAQGADQRSWFERNIDPSLYPNGTSIHAVANPAAPASAPSYGNKADGNGMAVLGVMRRFMGDFVQGRNLPPGTYNLYKEMGSEMFGTLFGAGQASRNPVSTQRGKFMLPVPIRRFFHRDNGHPHPAKLEEGLAVIKAVLEDAYPHVSNGHPQGGYMLLYGDAIVTVDPKELKAYFSRLDIPEGFTLLLRRVPFEEAMAWGCAAINPATGRILRFSEKPGLKILKKGTQEKPVQEQELMRDFLNGEPIETLDKLTRENGLGESFSEIQDKLHDALSRQGLLIDDEYRTKGTASILMNTAIGVAGTGTVIRFLKMAGVDINDDGDFEVKRQGEAPMLPGDLDGTLTRAEELLASLVDENNVDTMVAAIQKRIDELSNDVYEQAGSVEFTSREIERPGNKGFVIQTLANLLKNLSGAGAAGPGGVRKLLEESVSSFGRRISVLDGLLRDGQQLDAMADIVNKMAAEANIADQVFEKAIDHLDIKDPLTASLEEGRLHLYKEAQASLRLLRDSLQGIDPDFEGVTRNLEIEMARMRPAIAALLRGITGRDPAGAELAYGPIYHAYASALWNLRIWQILRGERGNPGAGSLYGARFDGAWLDTGSTKNVVHYFLRESRAGKFISAIFGFAPIVFSVSAPGHAIASLSIAPENQVHPHALQVVSHLGGSHPIGGPRRMDERSAIFFSHVPWPFHLYPDSVVVEGVVYGKERNPRDGVNVQSFVTHAVWQGEPKPGEENLHFGDSVKGWLEHQDINTESLWSEMMPAKVRAKSPLFYARIFPGVSVQLMEKARLPGLSAEELKKSALDELDWELFRSMGEIWEWLQHKANAPPAAWVEAAKEGRLFSMSDQYVGDPQHYFQRQHKTIEALVAALHAHKMPLQIPAVKPGYWITDLAGPPDIPKMPPLPSAPQSVTKPAETSLPPSHGREGGALRPTEAHAFSRVMARIAAVLVGLTIVLNAPLWALALPLPWAIAAMGQEAAVLSRAVAIGDRGEMNADIPVAWYDFATQRADVSRVPALTRIFAHAHELARALTQSKSAITPRVVAPLTLGIAVLDYAAATLVHMLNEMISYLTGTPAPDLPMLRSMEKNAIEIDRYLAAPSGNRPPLPSGAWGRTWVGIKSRFEGVWKNTYTRETIAEAEARRILATNA